MNQAAKAWAAELRPYDDFLFYAPRALRIKDKAGQLIPFHPNRAQQHIHARLEAQKQAAGKVRALLLKGRQQGGSTYVEGRFFHRTTMHPGQRAFILTHLQEATENIFGITKRFYDNCPKILRPKASNKNANELVFGGLDSEFSVATARSKGTGRSATAQLFHGSEVAFWENAADHMAGIGQIVPNAPGTEIILESTANGVGNLFHGMWQDAERGHSEYIPIFVPWFWQPEYRLTPPPGWVPIPEDADYGHAYGLDIEQLHWRRRKISDDFRGDEALFDQEYPATPALAFRRVAGTPLITADLVVRARKTAGIEAMGARIMGVDPAEYGDDDSAIAFRQGRVVPHILRRSKLGTMQLAGLVAKLADDWKPDGINVDCTGVGSGVADRLIELGYPVLRVHFGERAVEEEQYMRRRDEMWDGMKKWLEDVPCQIPDDDVLQTDLTSVQYTYDSSRRLVLESKEKMRKEGLKSPDSGDALALTFAVPYHADAGKGKVDHQRRTNWRTT